MSHPMHLVLCWHMHQPWYREQADGAFHLPWVYLHALKDYTDMAAHLEAHPEMRCVVNFTPVLMLQLDDYATSLAESLQRGKPGPEAALNILAGWSPVPKDPKQRKQLIQDCLRAHAPRMIEPWPAFVELLQMSTDGDHRHVIDHRLAYLDDQYFLDLLTWYHLAWCGHSLRDISIVKMLRQQGYHFSTEQRQRLVKMMQQQIEQILPRYKMLADRDQIELSMTPHSHPIVPLMIDFKAMDCSQPEAPKPQYPEYPGGLDRAVWHMQEGIKVFEKFFARKPAGIWLSEGAVSEAAVAMLSSMDIKWTATGEGVWANSCLLSGIDLSDPDKRRSLFQPHQLGKLSTRVFFRDDGLSDKIGFDYQSWIAEDGARDLCNHLRNIHRFLDGNKPHCVNIILDGENAWEYYPDNAFHFLGALYSELAQQDFLTLSTFSETSEFCEPHQLDKLCPGSWVYGTFSTWIGEKDKNRGWDRLVEAKLAYDKAIKGRKLKAAQKHAATRQLAVCEGSDWFWWFGDYNPAGSVQDFDQLYRLQLKQLYQLLELEVPANLDEPLSMGGGGAENSGTMRRGQDH